MPNFGHLKIPYSPGMANVDHWVTWFYVLRFLEWVLTMAGPVGRLRRAGLGWIAAIWQDPTQLLAVCPHQVENFTKPLSNHFYLSDLWVCLMVVVRKMSMNISFLITDRQYKMVISDLLRIFRWIKMLQAVNHETSVPCLWLTACGGKKTFGEVVMTLLQSVVPCGWNKII